MISYFSIPNKTGKKSISELRCKGVSEPEGYQIRGERVLSPEVAFLSLEGCGFSLQVSGGKGRD